MTLYLLVRYRSGVVGETRREVHAVALDRDQLVWEELPDELRTLCGRETFRPAEMEHLNAPRGMPCVTCLARLPGVEPAPVPQLSEAEALRRYPQLRRQRH